MDCRAVRERLSLYLDGELSGSELKLIAEHIETCTACRAELSSLEQTVDWLRRLEPVAIPSGLKDKILARVWATSDSPPLAATQRLTMGWQRVWRRWGRTMSAAAAVLIVAVLIGKAVVSPGLGLKQEAYYGAAGSVSTESPAAGEAAPADQRASMYTMPDADVFTTKEMAEEIDRGPGGASAVNTERKVIQTAHLVLLVEKLDTAVDSIQAAVKECGGFVQSSNMFRQDSARGAHYSLRIPVDQFNNVLAQLETLGDVQNKGTTGQDVTEEYVDVDARRRNLVRQEERLLTILDQAKTVEDILKVEGQLERVRGEIEALTGRLRYLDDQVELSTVDVELRERPRSVTTVQMPDENGLIGRLSRAFTGSINLLLSYVSSAVVWSVAALPFVLVGVGVGALIWLFWRRSQNRWR